MTAFRTNCTRERVSRWDARGNGDTAISSPGEVDGGVAVVLCGGFGGVAVRKGTEKSVGQQAGDLNMRQGNGCRASSLQQWDGLMTPKHRRKGVSNRVLILQGFQMKKKLYLF